MTENHGVIDLRAHKRALRKRVVDALKRLYKGEPVAAVEISKALDMSLDDVQKCLRWARDAGRAGAVWLRHSEYVERWEPAHAVTVLPMPKRNAWRVARVVRKLWKPGALVTASMVASELDVPKRTVNRWLKNAERMRFVRSVNRKGWKLR